MEQKKLGFGLMRLPLTDSGDEGSIDIAASCEMADAFMEAGFTYFDTAWMYHDYKSECAVKEILVDRYPRDSYTLATKLHFEYLKEPADCERIFNEQLEKTGAGYFDYYLLHDLNSVSEETYEKVDAFRWLQKKKEAGLVKHVGFSMHDGPVFLDRILTRHPELEFVQLQINYLDWEHSAIEARKSYNVATEHGVPVIVMEPVKGGTLANIPAKAEALLRKRQPEASPASWAMRFAGGLENVFMVLSGMSNMEQMKDNIATMKDLPPLMQQERMILLRSVVGIINEGIAIPCTRCGYCLSGCPQDIPIPKYFDLYNADLQEIEGKEWLPQEAYYDCLVMEKGKASDCIECGACERICPQHLPIIDNLKMISEHYGR